MPFSRRFAYVLLQFFLPRTPQQLLPKRRRSGAKPCTAQAAPHPASTFCRGALFHNALRGSECFYEDVSPSETLLTERVMLVSWPRGATRAD